ncbi:hypothetical protein DEJ21_14090 [Curtobacterium sp. MCSS17_006]|uniref:hypothetical protein n=1 Tax=Curtobacterium sp. MCSS17_006 TaxID=2175642 RepID=UPI000DA833DC|nr:hypothetical protein [Curtobacterium sp. MCSS17_006]PZE33975.1 hypothetical protein DEJ21_14090 [Curtobacterium sp. MCSS17_006]
MADDADLNTMQPGTRFTAEGAGVPDTPHRFHLMERGGVRWLTCLTHGTGARPDYVDPSTIRDVQLPARREED